MTAAELKQYGRDTLVPKRTIAQEILVVDAIVDFISQAVTSGIPNWTNALTFQTDGTAAGKYSIYPDTNGKIRFWKTLVANNINNPPPTNPATTSNAFWTLVNPSDGSAMKEWAAGIYGTGLVIVYHDANGDGTDPALYLLKNPTRPYESTNINTEIAGGHWVKLTSTNPELNYSGTPTSAALRGCGTSAITLLAAPGANKYFQIKAATISKKAGGTNFDFTSNLVIKTASGDVLFYIDFGLINNGTDYNFDLVKMGQLTGTNEALILTTEDGTNATAGTGDLDIALTYLIKNKNT